MNLILERVADPGPWARPESQSDGRGLGLGPVWSEWLNHRLNVEMQLVAFGSDDQAR